MFTGKRGNVEVFKSSNARIAFDLFGNRDMVPPLGHTVTLWKDSVLLGTRYPDGGINITFQGREEGLR